MTVPLRYDEFRDVLSGMARDGSPDLDLATMPSVVRDGWPSWDAHWPESCAKFVVDGVDIYDEDLLAFGLQMAQHSVLPLPAPAFFIQWRHEVVFDNGRRETQDSALFVMCLDDQDGRLKVALMHGAIRGDSRGLNLPVAIDLYGEKAADILNRKGADAIDVNELGGMMDMILATNLEELLAFLALISAKNIVQERSSVPKRLQERRQKKGLAPLPEFVRIKVPGGVIEEERRAAGFDRAAPRPHFRRGHIRLIYKGTEQQRVVSVSPTWVNSVRGNGVTMRPYKITH